MKDRLTDGEVKWYDPCQSDIAGQESSRRMAQPVLYRAALLWRIHLIDKNRSGDTLCDEPLDGGIRLGDRCRFRRCHDDYGICHSGKVGSLIQIGAGVNQQPVLTTFKVSQGVPERRGDWASAEPIGTRKERHIGTGIQTDLIERSSSRGDMIQVPVTVLTTQQSQASGPRTGIDHADERSGASQRERQIERDDALADSPFAADDGDRPTPPIGLGCDRCGTVPICDHGPQFARLVLADN